MSIQDSFSFDKDGEVVSFMTMRRFFLTLVIILVGLISFGLGRLSGEVQSSQPSEVTISYGSGLTEPNTTSAGTGSGSIVASSAGTKYYLPGCANNISAKNKISFASASLAEAAGYTLAANCKKP